MRKLLGITVLVLCFCNGLALADEPSTNAVVQGNQGYVYGSAPKEENTAVATTGSDADNPIAGIVNGIWKIDAWIQKNLW